MHLNTALDAAAVAAGKPDALIVATGSLPVVPRSIDGIDGENVVLAQDVLMGKVETGRRVVVIGGGLVGAETADFLAHHGKEVSIIEMMDEIMRDGEPTPRAMLIDRLAKNGVNIYTETQVIAIESDAVVAERGGESVRLEGINTVIIAIGVRANKTLEESLVDKFSGELFVVGDAKKAKNGYLGIQEGFEAGMLV